jgi:soluble lytic murein transglycosylase
MLEMNQAFRKGDRKRLAALLPQVRGHALEPWAAYWELRARLDRRIQRRRSATFLQRWAGTYQEDRLRNDWLLLLGQRRDWATFMPPSTRTFACATTAKCVLCAADRPQPPAKTDVAARCAVTGLAQRDADDGCAIAAEACSRRAQAQAPGRLAQGAPGHGGQPPASAARGRRSAAQSRLDRTGARV